MVVAEPCPGDPRLQAAMQAAVAGWPRKFFRRGPRQSVVTPLAAHAVWPDVDSSVDRYSAAAPCAKNHGEDDACSRRGTIRRLRYRQAVRVIGATYGPPHGHA